MKRLPLCLLLLLLCLSAAAWWAVQGDSAEPQPSCLNTEPAPYPADMERRMARVAGIRLCRGADPAAALPPAEAWQEGLQEPEIGDPRAVKGGRVQLCNTGPYPQHWLAFGGTMPQFFHYSLFRTVEVPPLARHPVTGHPIPGTAQAWALCGRTLFLRLNPAATYSNGRPVRAGDYLLGALLRAECGCAEHEQLTAAAEELRVWDEHTLSLTLRKPPEDGADTAAALLHAAEPGFYAEFGSDYRERYARRVPPTTGAYTVGTTERNRRIELVRVRSWWAEHLRYYRYTCNADSVVHHFLTDEAQAWEFLRRGLLDFIQTRHVAAWQEAQAANDGSLIFRRFDTDYPMPPYGIALNTRTLPNRDLRRGLLQAMDMERVIAVLFRGEGERLRTFSTGYGALTPRTTPQDRYDPAAARASFARAGYTQSGEDGILRRADGTRLSVRLAYTPSAHTDTMVPLLRESARVCGAEIVPEPLPWQGCDRLRREGRHEMLFWADVAGSPLPSYDAFFSSDRAADNTPFRLRDAAVDAALEQYRRAPAAERAAAVAAVDARLYDAACWCPGWKESRALLAYRPRLHFPDTDGCRFSVPAPYDVAEAHLYWVEDEP